MFINSQPFRAALRANRLRGAFPRRLAQRPRPELAGVLAGELIELSDGVYVLLNPAGVETGDAGDIIASPSSRRAC